MRKILFGICVCLIMNVAIADSLPKVDLHLDGSYNDVMKAMNDYEIRMDAVRPVLFQFSLFVREKDCGYEFGDDFFNVLNANVKAEGALGCNNSILYIGNKDDFTRTLRTKLQTTKRLTLKLLYDVCMSHAFSSGEHWISKVDMGVFQKEIEERQKTHAGADETCDMFIQMIVLKHNQLVEKSQSVSETAKSMVETPNQQAQVSHVEQGDKTKKTPYGTGNWY